MKAAAAFCLAILLGFMVAGGATSGAKSYTARVVGVADGDTITVLTRDNRQVKVRLAEIDAPEGGQPWGDKSKQVLSSLVFAKTVVVTPQDVDRYGRVVAQVVVDGRNVNAEMVRSGGAWAFRRYLKDRRLISLEAGARRDRVGLWSMPPDQIVAPWEWRANRRGQSTQGSARSVGVAQSAEPFSTLAGCDKKRYCREMASCAEAKFYLQHCGLAHLDGDGDGVPCEAICR